MSLVWRFLPFPFPICPPQFPLLRITSQSLHKVLRGCHWRCNPSAQRKGRYFHCSLLGSYLELRNKETENRFNSILLRDGYWGSVLLYSDPSIQPPIHSTSPGILQVHFFSLKMAQGSYRGYSQRTELVRVSVPHTLHLWKQLFLLIVWESSKISTNYTALRSFP